jgi:hypothetical protein
MTRGNLIVRPAALLLLALPLAACSGGSTDAADASSSAVSSSGSTAASGTTSASGTSASAAAPSAATPSASGGAGAAQDPDVQKDCLVAGLTYLPLKTALSGTDEDLVTALQSASPPDFKEVGQTKHGKAAEAALLKLGSTVAAEQGAVSTGNAPDRAGLQKAYDAASTACAPLSAAF